MARRLGWLRSRMGVRAVSALSAAVVVAFVLLAAGAALVFLVQQSLRDSVEGEATQQANLIATRLEGNFQDRANENAREAIGALTRESEDIAQVVVEYGGGDSEFDRNLMVEAGTDPVGWGPDTPAISDLWPDVGETVVVPNTPVRLLDGTVEDTVLVAIGAESDDRHVVLLYAAPLTGVDRATGTLLFFLLWGIPLLIVVTGLTTYLFAGRALRPVEAIRAQVAEMTEKDLGRRVPVPPARDEVGMLAETMNGMISRLEDAQGVQRRFVADASHELRSPLATIATGLELVEQGSGDRSTVKALRGETSRLGKLVEGLILLARADERGLQPRREEVDLDEVAEVERGRPAEGAVTAEVRTEPVRVVGDRGQLARVVRNLVDNARRHARSQVLVTVAKEADTAVVEVSDDGPGVPLADRARVFERFVRLDDARARHDGGSGLGLAIVAEVVAVHGGTVEITDAASGGALFRVRLPAAAEPLPDEQPAPAAAVSPDGPPAAPAPPKGSRPAPAAVRPGPAPTDRPRPAPAPAPVPGIARAPVTTPTARPRPTPGPAAVPVPAASSGSTAAPGTEPSPGTEPRPPLPRRVPMNQRPVRDEDARRDPATAPQGIPAVAAGEPGAGGVPPHQPRAGSAPARRNPVPAPRPQPGSAIR